MGVLEKFILQKSQNLQKKLKYLQLSTRLEKYVKVPNSDLNDSTESPLRIKYNFNDNWRREDVDSLQTMCHVFFNAIYLSAYHLTTIYSPFYHHHTAEVYPKISALAKFVQKQDT